MSKETIQRRVKEVMAGLFSLDTINISADSSIETIEQWDSLQHVNLMMAFEQEFGIRIDVEDAVEMTSFTAICKILVGYFGDGE